MLTTKQIKNFDKNGYLVIEDYINKNQRDSLMNRAKELIDNFEPSSSHSVFKQTNKSELVMSIF